MLARRSGNPRLALRLRPAALHGHARVVFRGTAYPTLARHAGGVVEGALVRPGPSAMAALRRYEGACYRLIPLRVRSGRGLRWARAWMVPRRMAAPDEWRPGLTHGSRPG